MTQEQAARIQREILPGSGCDPAGKPFLTYGIWVLPVTHAGVGLNVFVIDRPITSESDHEKAKTEAVQKLQEALAR
jgi:hypothetical protein